MKTPEEKKITKMIKMDKTKKSKPIISIITGTTLTVSGIAILNISEKSTTSWMPDYHPYIGIGGIILLLGIIIITIGIFATRK